MCQVTQHTDSIEATHKAACKMQQTFSEASLSFRMRSAGFAIYDPYSNTAYAVHKLGP